MSDWSALFIAWLAAVVLICAWIRYGKRMRP
jgi:4-amino-4-deoxy-L-arabinose transferase-like glycosyltransferase